MSNLLLSLLKKQHKFSSDSYAQSAFGFEFPFEYIPEKSDELQKILNTQKQNESFLDLYKAVNPQNSYLTLQKIIIHGYHTAFYTQSNLKLNLKNRIRFILEGKS